MRRDPRIPAARSRLKKPRRDNANQSTPRENYYDYRDRAPSSLKAARASDRYIIPPTSRPLCENKAAWLRAIKKPRAREILLTRIPRDSRSMARAIAIEMAALYSRPFNAILSIGRRDFTTARLGRYRGRLRLPYCFRLLRQTITRSLVRDITTGFQRTSIVRSCKTLCFFRQLKYTKVIVFMKISITPELMLLIIKFKKILIN